MSSLVALARVQQYPQLLLNSESRHQIVIATGTIPKLAHTRKNLPFLPVHFATLEIGINHATTAAADTRLFSCPLKHSTDAAANAAVLSRNGRTEQILPVTASVFCF
jgi:hypothetical protein